MLSNEITTTITATTTALEHWAPTFQLWLGVGAGLVLFLLLVLLIVALARGASAIVKVRNDNRKRGSEK